MRKLLSQNQPNLEMLNGIYWIMDKNSKGRWIKKNAPILFCKNLTEVPDV